MGYAMSSLRGIRTHSRLRQYETTKKIAKKTNKQYVKRTAADANLDHVQPTASTSTVPIPTGKRPIPILISPIFIVPTADDIKMGALYNPLLLSDYGGPCFQHQKALLKQLDVRNTIGNLIPPWGLYDALRPGTLILATVTLHCYVFNDTDRGRKASSFYDIPLSQASSYLSQAYQITAHKIRILDRSDEEIETRLVPTLPGQSKDDDDSDELFNSFTAKRAKINMDL